MRQQPDDFRAALDELRAARLVQAQAELVALHRERAIQRAQAAERDPKRDAELRSSLAAAFSNCKTPHWERSKIADLPAYSPQPESSPMIRLAFALLLALAPFGADAGQLFVSPEGSDRGECKSQKKPCATIGRACSVANNAADRATGIYVAGGVYRKNTSCDIFYHRFVGVYGDCNDRPDIVLSGDDVAFRAQDSAILVVQCVNIRSVGNGSIAFASRQFAIMDVDNVRIGQLAGGTVMAAQEMSKINCVSGLVLYGSVSYVATAGGMSTVILSCAFKFENTPQVKAIALAAQKSLIVASSSS